MIFEKVRLEIYQPCALYLRPEGRSFTAQG
ncbi:hypothetical protein NTHI1209_02087 [Haemophilus influenzae]|uniref:Uncharacterized protein n=1 Tax=Haemophilus influenzae TaxID=727 RepID=A0A158SZZ3_HAEIF|nr:hypothetical protein NTHI1209_02087 [Haemophilus influenzae]